MGLNLGFVAHLLPCTIVPATNHLMVVSLDLRRIQIKKLYTRSL